MTIKVIHVSCAIISIIGFTLRGYLKITRPSLVRGFSFRVLPHIIDTVLLISAITLVLLTGQYPFSTPWVTAKVLALLVYIGLGIVLMRKAESKISQTFVYSLALLTAAYIVMTALTRNPLPLT